MSFYSEPKYPIAWFAKWFRLGSNRGITS